MPDPEGLSRPDATARVFFALWPDEATRARLDRLAAEQHRLRGGRRTRAETIHLTLVFVGELSRDRLPELGTRAAELVVPAFEIAFDRVDCWRHNRIAFLTASAPPEALLSLVGGLEQALDQAGIRFDRRPYKPHITLVRHADCRRANENPAPDPIRWAARDFVLLESSLRPEAARYAQLGRYPLR